MFQLNVQLQITRIIQQETRKPIQVIPFPSPVVIDPILSNAQNKAPSTNGHAESVHPITGSYSGFP